MYVHLGWWEGVLDFLGWVRDGRKKGDHLMATNRVLAQGQWLGDENAHLYWLRFGSTNRAFQVR